MKKILILFDLVLFFASCSSPNEKKKLNFQTFIQGDSGYIQKEEGLKFLLKNKLSDTISRNDLESYWNNIKSNDTIGKFYKFNPNGDYLICFNDYSSKYTFPTLLLVKLKRNGDIDNYETYNHWNYSGCLSEDYEALQKINHFYSLTICSTGSGYGGTHKYFFKDILPQNKTNTIKINLFQGMRGFTVTLNSKLHFSNDSIIVDYNYKQIVEINRIDSTMDNFRVKYFLKDKLWLTADTNNDNKGLLDLSID